MFVNETNERVETLTRLNEFLDSMKTSQLIALGDYELPLAASAFGATADTEVDAAISGSSYSMSNGWVDVGEVVDAIKEARSTAASTAETEEAGPAGYEAYENPPFWAYINVNGYSLDDQAIKLLVRAAHDDGNSRHQTSKAERPPSDADAYIHSGQNKLYAFKDDGDHNGYPKVTVLAEGNVSDGMHRFRG